MWSHTPPTKQKKKGLIFISIYELNHRHLVTWFPFLGFFFCNVIVVKVLSADQVVKLLTRSRIRWHSHQWYSRQLVMIRQSNFGRPKAVAATVPFNTLIRFVLHLVWFSSGLCSIFLMILCRFGSLIFCLNLRVIMHTGR